MPELSDSVVTVFEVRRRPLVASPEGGVVLIGAALGPPFIVCGKSGGLKVLDLRVLAEVLGFGRRIGRDLGDLEPCAGVNLN